MPKRTCLGVGVGALLLIRVATAPAQGLSPTRVWSASFPQGAHGFSLALDSSVRSPDAAIILQDQCGTVTTVGATGTLSELSTHFPTPSFSSPPARTWTIPSAQASYVVVFDSVAKPAEDGWILPIPSASLVKSDGTVKGSYANLLDGGRLSEDGSVLVNFATKHSGLHPDAPVELEGGALQFFDGSGQRTGLVHDPEAWLEFADLTRDGALFVHARIVNESLSVAGRSNTGALLWEVPLPGQSLRRLRVAPGGQRVLIQTRDAQTGQPLAPRLHDGSGNMIQVLDQAPLHLVNLQFSASSELVALTAWERVDVVQTSNGATLSSSSPAPQRRYYDAAIDDTGRFLVTSSMLGDVPNYSPETYPEQLFVELHDLLTTSRVVLGTVPRTDALIDRFPPRYGARVYMADDGKALLVQATTTLQLYVAP